MASIGEHDIATCKQLAFKNAVREKLQAAHILPPPPSIGDDDMNTQALCQPELQQNPLPLPMIQLKRSRPIQMNDADRLTQVRTMTPEPGERNLRAAGRTMHAFGQQSLHQKQSITLVCLHEQHRRLLKQSRHMVNEEKLLPNPTP